MLQSRLITLFRAFNKDELKRFEAFLLSPYFNQSDTLIKFFRLIEPHQPLFNSKKLEKEKLYKALYGKSSYNDTNMRKVVSELFKMAKAFATHEQLRQADFDASIFRFDWLLDHGLGKLADAELESHQSLLVDYSKHDDVYYHHQRKQDQYKFERISQRFRNAEHKLLRDFDIFAHIHSLNREYLINSISLHIYLFTLARIYNLSLNEATFQQLETIAHPYINKGDAVIDLFYNIFQLVRTNEEIYFFELKTRLLKNDGAIPVPWLWEAGVSLENYCIKKIREGDDRFVGEVMQIYRFEVENGLYLQMGKMDYIYYQNIACKGSETAELDWTEYFIENYKKYLPAEFQEDAYNHAVAHVLFARKKYDEALRSALSCKLPNLMSKIMIKNLVARTHYELGMLDELRVELDTYRPHLKDEKFSEERRQYFQNFVIALRQLGDLKGNYEADKQLQLSRYVEVNKSLANRSWFLEKIRELQEARGRRG